LKKIIKKIIKEVVSSITRKKQRDNIAKLLDNLKSKGFYKKYPLEHYPPAITNYSFYRKSDLKWLDFYFSVNEKADQNYISVPIYYFIETSLNHQMLIYGVKEKNFYNKFLPDIPTPKTLFRRINGFYYDTYYQKIDLNELTHSLKAHGKLILKPSIESGSGSSIQIFEQTDGLLLNNKNVLNAEFLNNYHKNFLIQEFITQHDFFSQFNPTSNNTVRVFLYRSIRDDSVNILHCLLRVGAPGSYLDHDHLGGVVLAIDDRNMISQHAFDMYGNKYKIVNDINVSLLGQVPAMDKIRKLSIDIANSIYYGRILALDFTVTNEGNPLFLEINCWRNGINQYQMHNGSLFKEFTLEILEHCNTDPTKLYIVQIPRY